MRAEVLRGPRRSWITLPKLTNGTNGPMTRFSSLRTQASIAKTPNLRGFGERDRCCEGSAAIGVPATLGGALFRCGVERARFNKTARASTAIGYQIDDHCAEQEHCAEADQWKKESPIGCDGGEEGESVEGRAAR
jgi:hypothetical protein